jgi:hypothetical protein
MPAKYAGWTLRKRRAVPLNSGVRFFMSDNDNKYESIYTLENFKIFIFIVVALGILLYVRSDDNIVSNYLDEIRESHPTIFFIGAISITLVMIVSGVKHHKQGVELIDNWRLHRGGLLLLIILLIVLI